MAICAIVLCSSAAYLLLMRDQHSLLHYADAVSHLVISRSVFDSINPGMGMMGGVWLPLGHLMLMPFVTSDFLFHTGLAGTIVSTLSIAVTASTMLRIAKLQFNLSVMAGLISASLYMMNTSVIYMGVVPMQEAPFMMFFVLSAYYLQRIYYSRIHIDSNLVVNLKDQALFVKCALVISAATLIRYEGWLLPFAFIIVLKAAKFVLRTKNEMWRPRFGWFESVCIFLSFSGIIFWFIWDFAYYRDSLYFATGPYSPQIQNQPFSGYFHLNPVLVLSTLIGISKAMYGIPVLIIAIFGIVSYIYITRKDHRRLVFFLLTMVILMIPLLSIFLSMIQGSAVIYPIKEGGWFNGRYLTTISPLLAFCSVSLIMSVYERVRSRKSIITGAISSVVIVIVLSFYISTFISNPLEIGRATALNDRFVLLPFSKQFQFAIDTGDALRKLTSDKRALIVLFTPSQNGQEIILESGLPVKNFIDVGSGSYWDISKSAPWTYASHLVIRKPMDIHRDPKNNLIDYWTQNQEIIMKHFNPAYENPYFMVLKNFTRR